MFALSQPVAAAVEGFDCDPEPTTDQVIAYGDVLTGGNCVIAPAGDVDIFQFSGSPGDDVRIILTRTGGPSLPCLELRDPSNTVVVPETCSLAVQFDQTLTQSGQYKLLVTEAGNDGTFNYNLSLERLFPFRNPTVVAYGQVVADAMIAPASDIDTYSFDASVGDEVRLIITRTGGPSMPCAELRDSLNTEVVPLTCGLVVQLDETLTTSGIHQLIVTESGNDGTFTHNVSLQCISGNCAPVAPSCDVELSFADSTLTMDFRLASPVPANWRLGLVSLVGGVDLFSTAIPVVDPPVSFPSAIPGFPSVGKIVVWSSLATLDGITCVDFDTVDTGPLAPGAKLPTAEELQGLLSGRWMPHR